LARCLGGAAVNGLFLTLRDAEVRKDRREIRFYVNFQIPILTIRDQNPLEPRELLTKSLAEHLETIQTLTGPLLDEIERAGDLICQALNNGNKILLCGNGGSAADAQHIAAELVGC